MENFPMETLVVVTEESEKSTEENVPAKVSETRGDLQGPEMNKAPVEQVNMLDVTKLSYEVQQGYRVYVELVSDTYKNVTWPFYDPVDAEALGLWDYHEKIKDPMSFYQMGSKFNNYEYTSVTEVISDIRLILENCYRYNGPGHWVSKLGQKLEKILEQKLALLNRSLRDKVSLKATMELKRNIIPEDTTDGTSRRRSTPRNSYLSMLNGESSSSLLTQIKIQEDIEERERRRVREKEKKEANLVLLQGLAEWEEKELSPDIMKQLHSMWEIPSLAGLLFLLKDVLYLQDMSVAELELSFVYANKSSLLAKIYTALLLTPHQRKSLFKKPPMKFKVWESKLCDRINSWYKAVEKDGQEIACHQCGLDLAMFDVLGEINPLLEKSYMDLTLHQRVWILKCLCDNSLVRDYDFREQLSAVNPTDQRELLLGNDANNWQYLYFPIFSAADLRIYRQCPLATPSLSKRKKKVPPPPAPTVVKAKVTPRPATPIQTKRNSRLRQLRRTPSPEPEPEPSPPPSPETEPPAPEIKNTITEGFEMAAYDIETLKQLCDKFDEPPPPPKKRGRKPKAPPPRKRCEVDLHQTLVALLEELEQYEASFSKLLSKAKIKIMKESLEPEPQDEPEEVIPAEVEEEWGSEESIGDEIEDAGAKNMSSDEDFILEDEGRSKNQAPTTELGKKSNEGGDNSSSAGAGNLLPQKRKAIDVIVPVDEKRPSASPDVNDNDDSCSISIQTAPLRLKKKRKKPPSVSEVATSTASQGTGGGIVPGGTLPSAVQVSTLHHVPAGLQLVDRVTTNDAAKKSLTEINNTAVGNTTNTSGSVGNWNQTDTNTSLVQRLAAGEKLPIPVAPSSGPSLVKTVTLPVTSLPVPSVQTVPAVQRITGSKVPVTSPSIKPSALFSTATPGVGKVVLVTSSGVPLKVLHTVPASQVKTVNAGVPIAQGKQIPSQSLSNPIVLTPANVRPPSTNATTSSPSANPKVLAPSTSTLSSTTSVRPSAPPVLMVQRSGAGGSLPLSSLKGGAIVVSAPSASQQLVILRSPNASSTSGTTLLSSSGVSFAQIAKTALRQKVILSPGIGATPKVTSVATVNKPVLLVTTTSSVLKPSEVHAVKPVYVASAEMSRTDDGKSGSDGGMSQTDNGMSRTNGGMTRTDGGMSRTDSGMSRSDAGMTRSDGGRTQIDSGMSRSDGESVVKTVASCSNWSTVLDTRTVTSPSAIVGQSKTNPNGTDHSSPSKKTKLAEDCKAVNLVGESAKREASTDLNEPSVDLTCYETSVTDSTPFDEADDKTPDVQSDMTISSPSKPRETDVKLCNGISVSLAQCARLELEQSVTEEHQNQHILATQSTTNGVAIDSSVAQ